MKDFIATLRPALVSIAVFTALCGLVYPIVIGVAAVAIPHPSPRQLVGQPFDDPQYFWSRPTAVANYNAMTSAGTNAGPTAYADGKLVKNPALVDAASARIQALRDADPGNTAKVPVDLVTASGSGLDPEISPAAAHYQAARVARLRDIPLDRVTALIDGVTVERTLGVLGERRVNVVRLNQELDKLARKR